MNSELQNLEEDLMRRIHAGKNNAVLLVADNNPCICIHNSRFEVVEYSISLEHPNGEKIFLRMGGGIKQPRNEEKHYLFMDDKGDERNPVRFVLCKGDARVASSLDSISGQVYIAVKNGNSDKPHVISFIVAQNNDEVCSVFVSDGDTNIFQYCRYMSLIFGEGK